MKKITLTIYLAIFYAACYSQNPSNDKNWSIHFSDDFIGSIVDASKWDYKVPWASCSNDACLSMNPENRSITNGILNLTVKKENCQCQFWDGTLYNKSYTMGAIFSKSTFKYGYFEILCKIPQLVGTSYTGKGFGPNFWLWPSAPDAYEPTKTNVRESEIDFFEFDAETNKHTCNVHYRDISMAENEPWVLRQPDSNNNDPYDFNVDFSTYHKFGCEWSPNYISFYFDDKLVRTTDVEYASKLIPMNIFVDINIPAKNFVKDFASNSLFPYTYNVDYVKVYKLKMECSTEINQANLDFTNFNYSVKKSITISNSSVPANSKVTLRATDFILINGEFTVPLGSEFAAVPTPCY